MSLCGPQFHLGELCRETRVSFAVLQGMVVSYDFRAPVFNEDEDSKTHVQRATASRHGSSPSARPVTVHARTKYRVHVGGQTFRNPFRERLGSTNKRNKEIYCRLMETCVKKKKKKNESFTQMSRIRYTSVGFLRSTWTPPRFVPLPAQVSRALRSVPATSPFGAPG